MGTIRLQTVGLGCASNSQQRIFSCRSQVFTCKTPSPSYAVKLLLAHQCAKQELNTEKRPTITQQSLEGARNGVKESLLPSLVLTFRSPSLGPSQLALFTVKRPHPPGMPGCEWRCGSPSELVFRNSLGFPLRSRQLDPTISPS